MKKNDKIPVSSTNKTRHRDIAGILLKVVLNTITLTPKPINRNIKIVILRRKQIKFYIINGNVDVLCMNIYVFLITW